MSMKILITGAGGFIGGFIVEEALSRGYETWAGVRKTIFCAKRVIVQNNNSMVAALNNPDIRFTI